MIVSIKPSPVGEVVGRGVEIEEYNNEHDALQAMLLVMDALHAYGFTPSDLGAAAAKLGSKVQMDGVGIIADN